MEAGIVRRASGAERTAGRLAAAMALAAMVLSAILAPATGANPKKADGDLFDVGTAAVDITRAADHPQLLGGYEEMDIPTAEANDPLRVRAFLVAHGKRPAAFVIADSPGWFAGYQEGPCERRDHRWIRQDPLGELGEVREVRQDRRDDEDLQSPQEEVKGLPQLDFRRWCR